MVQWDIKWPGNLGHTKFLQMVVEQQQTTKSNFDIMLRAAHFIVQDNSIPAELEVPVHIEQLIRQEIQIHSFDLELDVSYGLKNIT